MAYTPNPFVFIGNWFDDIVFDQSRSSFVFGNGGYDAFNAHATDFYVGPGAPVGYYEDYFDGGGGVDVIIYQAATTAVRVDLEAGAAYRVTGAGALFARDTLVNIENVWGSNFDDKLYGDAQANALAGFDGDDRMWGRDGDDAMAGYAGDDRLYGGNGDDFLEGDAGKDRLYGQADDDTLFGGADDDYLSGGSGEDTVRGGEGADIIYTGKGADIVFYDNGDFGIDELRDFVLGTDRLGFSNDFFEVEPVGEVALADVLFAFPVLGDPSDSWLVAFTTAGWQTIAEIDNVAAADLNLAIADGSLIA